MVVFLAWAADDAGFQTRVWYPGALFFLGLAYVAAFAYRIDRPEAWLLAAVGIFAAFAAWCGLSLVWSSDRGIAWDGANRTLLYLLVFALFALLPWPRAAVPMLLCAFSLGVLAIGLVDLGRASWGEADRFFIHGRFAAPAGYSNAACGLYLMSFWPLAYVAARRECPPVIRGILLAAATALFELAVLAESRGSLFAVPIVVVAYLVVVPRRVRAGAALLVVGITVYAGSGPLIRVYDSVRNNHDPAGHLARALAIIATSAVAVFAVWTIVSYIDRRVELGSRAVRLTNASAVIAVLVIVIAGAILFATARPGPGQRISDAWRHFKAGYPTKVTGSHFSIGLGNNRYDFWRVSLLEFRSHPVRGVGVDNFAEDYIRQRRSGEEPLYPHSLELRVLAQTGIVGAGLFGALGVATAVAIFLATRGPGFTSGAARAGVVAALYWVIHGSADWLWEFPGLAAPAFAWLGLAAARRAPTRARTEKLKPARLGLGLLLGTAVTASLAFPWAAELQTQRATNSWRNDPGGAFANLRSAGSLNPLSDRPDLLAGAIASRLDDLKTMRTSFERAIERNPRNWYAHLELALALAGLGRKAVALAELETAASLNPREKVIATVRRDVNAGRAIDRAGVDRIFQERVRTRTGR